MTAQKWLLIETLPYTKLSEEEGYDDEYINITPCNEYDAMLFALRGEEVRRDPYDN